MRKENFYAGPSTLPYCVLEELERTIKDHNGAGLSLIETSHRSKEYDLVHNEAIALIRELLDLPPNYKILFLGGGATMQFGMIPMNFLSRNDFCDFAVTGAWGKKALADTKKIGTAKIIFDGKDCNYNSIPDKLELSKDAAYLYLTSNETIGGVQWKEWPDSGSVPIICDMSSDIMSRRLPVEKFGMIFAGAQKNLGPAGVTLVIIRDDMLEKCPDNLPAYLNYRTHSEKNSLYNTPPVFSIYAVKLVLQWIKDNGGISAVEERNNKKAELLYSAIDNSEGYYKCPVVSRDRSRMNVVYKLPSEELDKKFVEEAAAKNMIGLKGHRSVGGCRASIYNAMSVENVVKLVEFMESFRKSNPAS